LHYKQRIEQALAQARRAQELDPLSLVVNMVYAALLHQAGQYDEAQKQALKLLELEPTFYGAHWILGGVLLKKGLYGEAIVECEKALSLGGGSQAMGLLGFAYGVVGEHGKAGALIERLIEQKEQGFAVAYQVATIQAGLGDSEKALGWLEKAYEERSGGLTTLKVDPVFDNVRSDPRFEDLLSRIGLSSN
jgi:adenylate cyclase